jgi:hypothetical protein
MMLTEDDDDVIQTFTADRTNDAFDVGGERAAVTTSLTSIIQLRSRET